MLQRKLSRSTVLMYKTHALGMKFSVSDSTGHGEGDLNINTVKTRFYNEQLLNLR